MANFRDDEDVQVDHPRNTDNLNMEVDENPAPPPYDVGLDEIKVDENVDDPVNNIQMDAGQDELLSDEVEGDVEHDKDQVTEWKLHL